MITSKRSGIWEIQKFEDSKIQFLRMIRVESIEQILLRCVGLMFFKCRVSLVRNPRASVLDCRVGCRGPREIRLLLAQTD